MSQYLQLEEIADNTESLAAGGTLSNMDTTLTSIETNTSNQSDPQGLALRSQAQLALGQWTPFYLPMAGFFDTGASSLLLPVAGGSAGVVKGPNGVAGLMYAVSSDANDTAAGTGAQQLFLEGTDGSNNLISETIALNGLTGVPTVNNYRDINRAFVSAVGATGTNLGTIEIYHDVGLTQRQGAMTVGDINMTFSSYAVPIGRSLYLTDLTLSFPDASAGDTADIDVWLESAGGLLARVARNTLGLSNGNLKLDLTSLPLINQANTLHLRALKTGAAGPERLFGALSGWLRTNP